MIFHWDATIIKSAIATLNAREQAAISALVAERRKPAIGIATAKKLGFTDLEDFRETMIAGMSHLRAYFAVLGIKSISDLDFVQPAMSIEGLLAKRRR